MEANKTLKTDLEVLTLAEEILGNNLVWITNQADLGIRQKDPETLNRLKELNDGWLVIVKHLKAKAVSSSAR